MKIQFPILALLPFSSATGDAVPPPTAVLDSGPIIGVQTSLPGGIGPVNKFLGIPYGAPPERFSMPKKPSPWSTPKKTVEFGPSCNQLFPHSDIATDYDVFENLFNGAHPPESEDCLFVNVFAPSSPPPKGGRPIMLLIPGGGWILGNGIADLSGFAAYEDIVAISINYRVNLLGFPNSPSIPVNERNLGLYDQRLALSWIHANAHAFGGDASKLTLLGQSAGSISIDFHMHSFAKTSPAPFRAGIMFSGQGSFGLLAQRANTSDYSAWNSVLKAAGCGCAKTHPEQIACLRKVPAAKLMDAQDKAQAFFSPVTDGVTVPRGRTQAWKTGDVMKVPIWTSTILQEGRSLLNSKVSLPLLEEVYLPEPLFTQKQRDDLVAFYKTLPGVETDFDIATAIYTDYAWQCPQALLANASAALNIPTWRHLFNISTTSLLPPPYSYLGKFHGSDTLMLLVSPTYEAPFFPIPGLTLELYAFANYFRGLVGKFVRNPQGGVGWPRVGSQYKPFDMAVLGDVGDTHTSGATPVDMNLVDERCAMYAEAIDALDSMN